MGRMVGVLACLLLGAALGCGDDYSNVPATTGPGTTSNIALEVAINSSGVSLPTNVVDVGSQIRFTNNDTVQHQISSNPHPNHTDCPELNNPMLAPGQTFVATMTVVRTCGFHDHLDPFNPLWQGTIEVRQPGVATNG